MRVHWKKTKQVKGEKAKEGIFRRFLPLPSLRLVSVCPRPLQVLSACPKYATCGFQSHHLQAVALEKPSSETHVSKRLRNITSYQMFPRSQQIPRKQGIRHILSAIAFFLTTVLFLSLQKSHKKRCTQTSNESYCPQPMQCVDSTSDNHRPRPLIVIAAGGQRSASTFLFNALRILLRIRDPNTVSGWYRDLQYMYNTYAQVMRRNDTVEDVSDGNRLEAFKTVGSLLVKIHTVRDWHAFLGGGDVQPAMEHVDAVYTSHRDVRQAVRSIRDMGWGRSHTVSQMAEVDFCRREARKRPTFFRRDDYSRGDTWVTVARTQILCREILLETAGRKLKLDIRAENVRDMDDRETVALLRQMSYDLDYKYSDAELNVAVKELKRLRPVECDKGFNVEMSVNPVTHLHKGHIRIGDTNEARIGMEAIERDPVCRKWLQQHRYVV